MRCRTILRMYRGIAVSLVITGALTGCGDSGQTPTASTVTITTERAPNEPPAAPTAAARTDATGALLKEVGEGAGVSCASPTEPCDIEFTVTAIEPNYPCNDAYNIAPLGPGQQYLRLSVDAQADAKLEWPASADALRINNWAVEDADGVLHRDLDIASPCIDNADAFFETFVPGTRMRGAVVVLAPVSATELRLISGPTSWIWPIPQQKP